MKRSGQGSESKRSKRSTPRTSTTPRKGSLTGTDGPTSSIQKSSKAEPKLSLAAHVVPFVPESKLLTELLELEHHIDTIYTRKHAELTTLPTVPRTLKVTIYNTYENQGAVYQPDDTAQLLGLEHPTWTLRIEGSVAPSAIGVLPPRKFTSFFKKIYVQLDPAVAPQHNTIEWHRSQSVTESDGFEITRTGDTPVQARIFMHLAYSPPRYRLSEQLQRTLGVHTDTRPRILVALWQYIRRNRLQDPNDRRIIHFNADLQRVFGMPSTQFMALPELIREHLSPPDPIEFVYDIVTSGDPLEHARAWEITIHEDAPRQEHTFATQLKQIHAIDTTLAERMAQLEAARTRREFMRGFSDAPVSFLNALIASTVRDSRVNASTIPSQAVTLEHTRDSDYFHQPLVPEAVSMYLSSRGSRKEEDPPKLQ